MIYENITLGKDVNVDPSANINNVCIRDHVKIAKNCSIYGSKKYPLEIGYNSYVGMNSILNGYSAKLTIGDNVSIAQNVNMMTDSGPNASLKLQKIYSICVKSIVIGDDSWIGASVIIMPGVHLGKCSIVAAGSYVAQSFPDYSVIGGVPARLIRRLSDKEIDIIEND